MGTGKKKIEIKRKDKESDRMVTFSKRRKGLFKKAHQLHVLSGAKIAVLVFSPAGKPYIYGDPSFHDIVNDYFHNTTMDNAAADYGDDKDYEEIELWKSRLGRMDIGECDNVDNLVIIKNDLEQIRDKLIEQIGGVHS